MLSVSRAWTLCSVLTVTLAYPQPPCRSWNMRLALAVLVTAQCQPLYALSVLGLHWPFVPWSWGGPELDPWNKTSLLLFSQGDNSLQITKKTSVLACRYIRTLLSLNSPLPIHPFSFDQTLQFNFFSWTTAPTTSLNGALSCEFCYFNNKPSWKGQRIERLLFAPQYGSLLYYRELFHLILTWMLGVKSIIPIFWVIKLEVIKLTQVEKVGYNEPEIRTQSCWTCKSVCFLSVPHYDHHHSAQMNYINHQAMKRNFNVLI